MYATVTDVTTRLGRPLADAVETAQVQAWIDDVEGLISSRIPALDDAVDSGAPTAAAVTAVVCAVVIRKINNPEGKLQERVDDYSYGLTATAVEHADLTLTNAEWGRLMPTSGVGAFSIRPGYEQAEVWPW